MKDMYMHDKGMEYDDAYLQTMTKRDDMPVYKEHNESTMVKSQGKVPSSGNVKY